MAGKFKNLLFLEGMFIVMVIIIICTYNMKLWNSFWVMDKWGNKGGIEGSAHRCE